MVWYREYQTRAAVYFRSRLITDEIHFSTLDDLNSVKRNGIVEYMRTTPRPAPVSAHIVQDLQCSSSERVTRIIEGYFFLFPHTNICCDPSLQPSRRDGSNEGSQHMLSLRNKIKCY